MASPSARPHLSGARSVPGAAEVTEVTEVTEAPVVAPASDPQATPAMPAAQEAPTRADTTDFPELAGSIGKSADDSSIPSLETQPPAEPTRKRRAPVIGLLIAVSVSTLTVVIVVALALAPLLAVGAAIWAGVTGLTNLWNLYALAKKSQVLVVFDPHAVTLLNTLETAERVGFLALGYLALLFALMTLMGGLLGRRWGRLYILPGAIFTLTAMAIISVGLLFAQPLFTSATFSGNWFIGVVIYALIDAPLVSAALVDTRLSRVPTATGRHQVVRLERKPFHNIRARRTAPLSARATTGALRAKNTTPLSR